MPKAAPEPEPEPMDIPEMAAEQERAVEPERAAKQEEQPKEEEEEEYEETIMLKASNFVAFQDILEDMQSQIADLQRNACQDMLRAILDRLPPAL
jgi:outer membrane biosynthesis protein TonB